METPSKAKRPARLRDLAIGCVCAFGVMLGALSLANHAFAADAYPTRPIRIIVPFPPGAITDAVSRMLATELGKVIGQSVVVENKPGASTLIATQETKNSPADGYSMLFQLSSLVTNLYLIEQPGYALSDFKPAAMLGQSAYVLVASKKRDFQAFKDLVAFGKAHPGELNCSGTGDGAATVIGSKLQQAAGIEWVLVNYKGGAGAVQAVMSGDVDISLPTQAAPLIYANSDKLRVLAITSKKRVEFLPDVPTFAELGYPAIDAQTWFGLFIRSETPPAVTDKLRSALAEVMRSPAMQERLRKLRISPYEGLLADVPARLKQELADFTREAKRVGVKPQ